MRRLLEIGLVVAVVALIMRFFSTPSPPLEKPEPLGEAILQHSTVTAYGQYFFEMRPAENDRFKWFGVLCSISPVGNYTAEGTISIAAARELFDKLDSFEGAVYDSGDWETLRLTRDGKVTEWKWDGAYQDPPRWLVRDELPGQVLEQFKARQRVLDVPDFGFALPWGGWMQQKRGIYDEIWHDDYFLKYQVSFEELVEDNETQIFIQQLGTNGGHCTNFRVISKEHNLHYIAEIPPPFGPVKTAGRISKEELQTLSELISDLDHSSLESGGCQDGVFYSVYTRAPITKYIQWYTVADAGSPEGEFLNELWNFQPFQESYDKLHERLRP